MNVAPLPTEFGIRSGAFENGTRFVIVEFSTPGGTNAYFFDADSAIRFGDSIKKAAQAEAVSKLVTPGGGQLVVPQPVVPQDVLVEPE